MTRLKSKLLEIAMYPKSGGILPGIAPTKTAKGVNFFSGVYTKVYKNIAKTPNKKHLKLIKKRKYTPNAPVIEQNVEASTLDKIFVGIGLLWVRSINLSDLYSITWLNPFADPVTKTPPIIK